jgi:hypothetical protein
MGLVAHTIVTGSVPSGWPCFGISGNEIYIFVRMRGPMFLIKVGPRIFFFLTSLSIAECCTPLIGWQVDVITYVIQQG